MLGVRAFDPPRDFASILMFDFFLNFSKKYFFGRLGKKSPKFWGSQKKSPNLKNLLRISLIILRKNDGIFEISKFFTKIFFGSQKFHNFFSSRPKKYFFEKLRKKSNIKIDAKFRGGSNAHAPSL